MSGEYKVMLAYVVVVFVFIFGFVFVVVPVITEAYQDTHKAPTNQQCIEVVK